MNRCAHTLYLVMLLPMFASTAVGQSVDFDSQIVPLLTRWGCNAGACHGAAAGRGELRLSLFGSNADADYHSLAVAFEGRRINLAKPELSLLLAKPTGRIDHGGDLVFDEDSAAADLLATWIQQGAKRGPRRKMTHFEVSPNQVLLTKQDATTQLRALAKFDNGPQVDVTAWTVFQCEDSGSVDLKLSPAQATVLRPGVHVVTARFLDRFVPISLALPFAESIDPLSRPSSDTNYIDQAIDQRLRQLGLDSSPAVDDALFVRRVFLDLAGRLPRRDEVESYVAGTDREKKRVLVEQLLASQEFVDIWTLRFSRWLKVHSIPNEEPALQQYTQWIRDSLANNKPFDVMARELLLSDGDSHELGAANFHRMFSDARNQAELVGTFFMGTRIQCANCHNHPLDRWTQEDYHGLAAIFSRIDRGRIVRLTATGAVTNPRTGEPAIPRIPGQEYLTSDGDSRIKLVDWLTQSPESPLARTMVNRLWAVMMGQALVDPLDDMRESNLATHPELLDKLAKDFIEHDFSIRYVIGLIATSETYARSIQPTQANKLDSRFYSHRRPKPMEPEVLLDAINDVLGLLQIDSGHDVGTRAIALIDPQSPSAALDALGRCSRLGGCSEAQQSLGLASKLHLINGDVINAKISDGRGRLQQLIRANKNDDDILEDFYLAALARRPSEAESAQWRAELKGLSSQERQMWLEDFVWSLLTSQEFSTNH
jgi:Protein of unknown function (DUF1549)/Protein of unknown function (DUF1553)